MPVHESVIRIEENKGQKSEMIGLELAGETRGEVLGDGTYSLDGIEITIDGHRLRLLDSGATGDPDANELRLSDWFR
jgi:hypothetical protein